MTSRSRKAALTAAALLVAAGLTSCIKVDMDIRLDDGKATGEAVLAVSEDLLEMSDGDPADLFADTDVPEGATAEPYDEDGFVGQRYIFEDIELSEFDNPGSLAITLDEESGTYEVNGTRDFGSEGDLADLPDVLVESFDVSVSVTFPGDVIEHNGELDGRTVTWTPAMGDVAELHAIAEEGESSTLAWLWVSLAVVAALLIAGLAFFLRRREGEDVATGGMNVPDAGTMSDQPTSPLAPLGAPDAADESPAGTAVESDVAPHDESPASAAAHETKPDDVPTHDASPAGAAVDEEADVVLHGESTASSAVGEGAATEPDTGESAQDDVPPPEPTDEDNNK